MSIPDKAITRGEQYLAAMAGQSGTLPDAPITRKERYLAKAAGQDVETPEPITREEMYLDVIAEGGGGGDITLTTLNVSANGTTDAPAGTAYNKVVASVANSYAAGDEGKVVSNGELVSQTSDTATSNGTVDTTLINSLTVNVAGPQEVLLGSGTYTVTGTPNSVAIPYSLTTPGTKTRLLVKKDHLDNATQTEAWGYLTSAFISTLPPFSDMFSTFNEARCVKADGTLAYTQSYQSNGSYKNMYYTSEQITIYPYDGTYRIRAGTYSWYIWGYAT